MPATEPVALDVTALYERYGRAVYRRCQYYLRNDADATDAMHDVFLKVVERHAGFRGQASPLTWMVRIATNHCLNIIRSRKAGWRDRYEKTVNVDHQGRGTSEYSRFERRELMRTILEKVDRKTQEAAAYYFVDEMNQEDAALAAGCSVPTLRKRLRAFIKIARRELKKIDADLIFGEAPI
ncbi:MAG: sigma-70 family RNA polymerase sigma factor [Myxococcota bacterium]